MRAFVSICLGCYAGCLVWDAAYARASLSKVQVIRPIHREALLLHARHPVRHVLELVAPVDVEHLEAGPLPGTVVV